MSWYNKPRKIKKLFDLDPSQILTIDLETTGVNFGVDEIIQIAIFNGSGSRVFSSYINPKAKSWPAAEKINHISKEMVKDSPTIKEVRKDLRRIFNHAKVLVGYNLSFDIQFLEDVGISVPTTKFDVSEEFLIYISKKGISITNFTGNSLIVLII